MASWDNQPEPTNDLLHSSLSEAQPTTIVAGRFIVGRLDDLPLGIEPASTQEVLKSNSQGASLELLLGYRSMG